MAMTVTMTTRSLVQWAFLAALVGMQISAALGHAADGDGDSGTVDLHSKGLVLVKVYCLIIVFFATFLGGISPYFFRWNHTFLVLGTQFAGGVFLATALIHFLGDSHSTFETLVTSTSYAFAEMLAVVGYLLTMLADVAIHSIYSRRSYETNNKVDAMQLEEGGVEVPETKAAIIATSNFGDALLLILALCFHSVFEGIAIGVAGSQADAWKALWTVSLHKIFAAIAMGIALLRMLPNRPLLTVCLYAFAFAISTPIGVAIGIVIDATAEGTTADWIYAVSMGIATGVFIYVAINHLLAKGYTPPRPLALDRPIFRWLAVVAGAALVAIALIWD